MYIYIYIYINNGFQIYKIEDHILKPFFYLNPHLLRKYLYNKMTCNSMRKVIFFKDMH